MIISDIGVGIVHVAWNNLILQMEIIEYHHLNRTDLENLVTNYAPEKLLTNFSDSVQIQMVPL